MYLTYDDYMNMGGTLSETAFNDFEIEAEVLVDWYTFNRLHKEAVLPVKVKQCIYKLISIAQLQNQSFSLGQNIDGSVTSAIASQSNDGVSISYNVLNASEAFERCKTESVNTIQRYLNGVKDSLGHKLLYRGVYPNE
jgi:hypothetical protein